MVYEPGSTTPSDYGSRHPPQNRGYTKQEKVELGVEEVDEEAEFIVNRIAFEMPDAVSLFSLQHYTKEDTELSVLMADIKRGKLSAKFNKGRFKECFQELSCCNGLVVRGQKILIPKELRPDVLKTKLDQF